MLDFHDILLAINDMSPEGVKYCISHYNIARVILMNLYRSLLVNERVENRIELKRTELTLEELQTIKKDMHNLIDKWF